MQFDCGQFPCYYSLLLRKFPRIWSDSLITTEFAITGIELKKVSTASMVNYLNTQECLMISKVLLDGSPPKNLIWKTFWTNLPKIFLHLDQSPKGTQIVVDDSNHPKINCNISSIGYIIEIMVWVKQARHRKVSWSELEKWQGPDRIKNFSVD